jgi:ribosomal protein S18 acetylase RimI-like enzyme
MSHHHDPWNAGSTSSSPNFTNEATTTTTVATVREINTTTTTTASIILRNSSTTSLNHAAAAQKDEEDEVEEVVEMLLEDDDSKEEEEEEEEEQAEVEQPPRRKKPRRCSSNSCRKMTRSSSSSSRCILRWDCKSKQRGDEWLGLADLFVGDSNNTLLQHQQQHQQRLPALYRLEIRHSSGGTADADAAGSSSPRRPQQEQESRILLFRSDRPGAIAKIIYSSSLSLSASSTSPLPPSTLELTVTVQKQPDNIMALLRAKIQVLTVQEAFRGRHDFGSLLLTQAMACLQRRCMNNNIMSNNNNSNSDDGIGIIYCQLEAEEDVQRHGQLIQFYQNLGFSVKPNVKTQYVNNTNGDCELYRKVAMERTIFMNNNHNRDDKGINAGSSFLLATDARDSDNKCRRRPFLPISFLCGICGCKVVDGVSTTTTRDTNNSNNDDHHTPTIRRQQAVYWLMVEHGEGRVEFQTTKGHSLLQLPSHDTYNHHHQQQQEQNPSMNIGGINQFQLLRVSDGDVMDEDHDDDSQEHQQQPSKVNHCGNDLWLLQTTAPTDSKTTTKTRPLFLTMQHQHHDQNHHHSLVCCTTPTFWHTGHDKACSNNDSITCSLVCTTDTPLRRRHYRNQWRRQQTVDQVESMQRRFLNFDHGKMTLQQALLTMAKTISAPSFRVHLHQVLDNQHGDDDDDDDDDATSCSLCTRCFAIAQAFRHAGHPDWVQLLALLYSLGSIVKCLDGEHYDYDDYDWTVPSQTWVAGCALPPSSVTFGQFQTLDEDSRCHCSSREEQKQIGGGTYPLHCGLNALLLPWTGPEYMYRMLQHNGICVPDEGMKMLRYATLVDWHTGNEYRHLANEDDVDVQGFVAEFSQIIMFHQDAPAPAATTVLDAHGGGDCALLLPSHEECDKLWETHYSDIAKKYNVGSILCW